MYSLRFLKPLLKSKKSALTVNPELFKHSLLFMFPLKEVMSVDEESTLCYCLLEAKRCHVLLEHPGRYALVGAPLNQDAAKRLRLAVFGSPDTCNSLGFTLRVYCVDDTPHAFQV